SDHLCLRCGLDGPRGQLRRSRGLRPSGGVGAPPVDAALAGVAGLAPIGRALVHRRRGVRCGGCLARDAPALAMASAPSRDWHTANLQPGAIGPDRWMVGGARASNCRLADRSRTAWPGIARCITVHAPVLPGVWTLRAPGAG